MSAIRLFERDCLEYMRSLPDGYYDFALADPPYGIGRDWDKRDWRSRQKYRDCGYLNLRPPKEVFDELRRVAKDWVVWGWNYFTDYFDPTNYLIVWDKMSNQNTVFRYSKCEIAATSVRIPCNLVSVGWDGYRMGEETGTKKIHPHQKPVALYRWILENYVKDSSKRIFDPFAGSCASAVACMQKGYSWDGCEIEPMFIDAAARRIVDECNSIRDCGFPTPELTLQRKENEKEDSKDHEGENRQEEHESQETGKTD